MKNGLVNKVFILNRNLFEEIMKKKNISKKQIEGEIITYLSNLHTNLYLEADKGKSFQIKDVNESLPVKLGWYRILDDIDPESIVAQCTLTPTEKGKEVYAQYRRSITKH